MKKEKAALFHLFSKLYSLFFCSSLIPFFLPWRYVQQQKPKKLNAVLWYFQYITERKQNLSHPYHSGGVQAFGTSYLIHLIRPHLPYLHLYLALCLLCDKSWGNYDKISKTRTKFPCLIFIVPSWSSGHKQRFVTDQKNKRNTQCYKRAKAWGNLQSMRGICRRKLHWDAIDQVTYSATNGTRGTQE